MTAVSRILTKQKAFNQTIRSYSSVCEDSNQRRGLVLGAYNVCGSDELQFSAAAQSFESKSNGKLGQLLKGAKLRMGNSLIFNNLGDYYAVAVVGVGNSGLGYDENENINECKENVRRAAAIGYRALEDMGCSNILVEEFTNAQSAAEGALLASWKFDDFKNPLKKSKKTIVEAHEVQDGAGWTKGYILADAQNLSRKLTDMPSNKMTPVIFAKNAIDILCPCGVNVEVRDRDWIESKNMSAFLGVAKSGACEDPLFLDISYCGGSQDDKPVVLIGKGVTHESGGICLHHCSKKSLIHKGEMAGASVVLGVLKAISSLAVPMNCNALIPLSENMPGAGAIKPGDVVLSLSGKTVQIEDTSKEARIILADILSYSTKLKPCLVNSVGTIDSGVKCCFGSTCTGVFSSSNIVWNEISKAGSETGDRVWRLPLWNVYKETLKHSSVDYNNVSSMKGGESCSAAAFLKEFAPESAFIHMDITGTGLSSPGTGMPYLRKGTMSGRPVRTIAQFLYQLACPRDAPGKC